MSHAAVSETFADRLADLGHLDAQRIRTRPAPGTATLDDLVRANGQGDGLCELIDHTLVEKAMSYEASVVAATILSILRQFINPRKLGIVSGADGMFRLIPGNVRGPDVAYASRDRFADGKFPSEAYPSMSPDLAVEVLSLGNTKAEMTRKRIEYFHSGVRLVWIVDCRSRSIAVYTAPDDVVILNEEATLTGGEVLPHFQTPVSAFFEDLDSLSKSPARS
ncbi:hypothetical protein LF1_25010 [Rubripirellula obstinata]|uniref:Putative restriction endonuclease domain-containing protein n=1 Tax=Rubripirellula obstinata TaxID=406547 RepID=A0A5B1CKN9_9BACT|nr:Uma2 family endonuclease [Rubripirellula obstinata]KAA1259963.1 hypothetical protein LF1_25010 [Rubripirellula obstinata]